MALQRRADTICSDEESKTEQLKTVRQDLLNNGCPGGFVFTSKYIHFHLHEITSCTSANKKK